MGKKFDSFQRGRAIVLPKNIQRFEKIVLSGTNGYHLLFSNYDRLRAAFKKMRFEETFQETRLFSPQSEELLVGVIQRENPDELKAYLDSLSEDDFILFLQTYFELIEVGLKNKYSEPH